MLLRNAEYKYKYKLQKHFFSFQFLHRVAEYKLKSNFLTDFAEHKYKTQKTVLILPLSCEMTKMLSSTIII